MKIRANNEVSKRVSDLELLNTGIRLLGTGNTLLKTQKTNVIDSIAQQDAKNIYRIIVLSTTPILYL